MLNVSQFERLAWFLERLAKCKKTCFKEISFATSGQKSIKMNSICSHPKKQHVAHFFLEVGQGKAKIETKLRM